VKTPMSINWKIKKIRILTINPSSSLGGGNTVSNNLVLGLDKNLFEVFSFFPEKGLAATEIENKVKVIFSPKSIFFSILYFLRNFIKKNKINIIHAQGTRAAFWIRLLFPFIKPRPKLIYTLHGFHIIRKNFFLKWPLVFLERFLNRWIDILVCVSESDQNLVLKYRTIPKNKIVVIRNGIEIEKFKVSEELVALEKEKLGLGDTFVLTAIGRLHHPKDFSTILRALKIIISSNKKFRLLIVGNGPFRESLEEETKNLALNQYVKFLGFREDIPILINLSDIVILSTKWEGLPLLPLEAGASRKPITASNVDGVRETIIDGKTGFLFKPGLAKDLAEKIVKLYGQEKLRKEMGENGFQHVLENFSKERMIKEYQKLYQLIL